MKTATQTRTGDLSTMQYAERYLTARDLSAGQADNIRRAVRYFEKWARRRVKISELDCDSANAWLATLQAKRISPHTVDSYRRGLLCVWNEAYRYGDNDNPPLRLKRIKKPRAKVTAFTHEEIGKLLDATKRFVKPLPDGNPESDWWFACVHVAYSTGLRRGDLMALKMTDIGAGGRATVIQHKTGYPVTVRLPTVALDALRVLKRRDDIALPWPYGINVVSIRFRELVESAKVRPGTLRWLRRAAGSYAEREQHGNGSAALGHRCEKVFRMSYEDCDISQSRPVSPPLLVCDLEISPRRVQPSQSPIPPELPEIELRLLRFMAEGIKAEGIAHRLGLDEQEYKAMKRAVFQKLGVSSGCRAIERAIREGLIEGPDHDYGDESEN